MMVIDGRSHDWLSVASGGRVLKHPTAAHLDSPICGGVSIQQFSTIWLNHRRERGLFLVARLRCRCGRLGVGKLLSQPVNLLLLHL